MEEMYRNKRATIHLYEKKKMNNGRELNDVNMACNLNINTGDFLSFADYFFDGFVVDWMVQDRINNARHQVEEAIRRTEYIINQLQYM